ncbi:hypothetical protein KKB18_02860 [bacterium]|nr:hypothetical protein [bacterium]
MKMLANKPVVKINRVCGSKSCLQAMYHFASTNRRNEYFRSIKLDFRLRLEPQKISPFVDD